MSNRAIRRCSPANLSLDSWISETWNRNMGQMYKLFSPNMLWAHLHPERTTDILLTSKLSVANSRATRASGKEWCLNLKAITGGCTASLNKTQAKFNERLHADISSLGSIFYDHHSPFFHFSFSSLLPVRPPPLSLCFHLKSTTLPPSFSLTIQNNSLSRKRAINLLPWEPSTRECQGYSRLLSLLTSTQHRITYRQRRGRWVESQAQ